MGAPEKYLLLNAVLFVVDVLIVGCRVAESIQTAVSHGQTGIFAFLIDHQNFGDDDQSEDGKERNDQQEAHAGPFFLVPCAAFELMATL